MKYLFFFILFIIISCQSTDITESIVFDNNILPQITISAKSFEINRLYETIYSDSYIDHSLKITPYERLEMWIKNNIKVIGDENKLEINVLDASIKKIEIKNEEAKKFEEKNIYKYELSYLVEYNLLQDSNYLISSTLVESSRTTTSGRYISISESEKIIDSLILDSLKDISRESEKLIRKFMTNYIL